MDDTKKAATLDTEEDDLDRYNPWGSKYNNSMCQEIIDMFSEGKTQAQFCSKHSLSTDTFQKWRKKYKKFNEACELAHNKARDYFDQMRADNMLDPDVNWGTFNKMYSARFNIADKRTVRVKGLSKSKDERQMLKCLSKAVEDEELTPDEVSKLLGIVDTSLKVKQTNELEDRLRFLETGLNPSSER